MKKFNLQKAIKGARVVTRSGYPVRLECLYFGVTYAIHGTVYCGSACPVTVSWTLQGRECEDSVSCYDLMLEQ